MSSSLHDSPNHNRATSSASRSDRPENLTTSPQQVSSSPPNSKMPQYTSRDGGDPTQIKKNKQSMADLKLRRLTELNNRLREDLDRERIPVSAASKRSANFHLYSSAQLLTKPPASSPTATGPETTWCPLSGAPSLRARTRTHLNNLAAAVSSCNKLF